MKSFYLHDERKFPVALVVSELKMEGIVFAVSTYNPIDQFDKAIARAVATGRLPIKGCNISIPAGNNVKARILEWIVADKAMPARTRRAAQLWLDNPPKKRVAA